MCGYHSLEEVIGYGVFPMGETFVKVETEMLRGKRSAGLGAPDSLTTTPSVNIIPEVRTLIVIVIPYPHYLNM